MTCPHCSLPIQFGDWPICEQGHSPSHGGNRIQAIHTSERAVVLHNPRTGEYRTPPVANSAMHPKYASQGYQRVELDTAQKLVEYERASGRIHEASHYNSGSGAAERDLQRGLDDTTTPTMSESKKRALIQAIS